MARLPEVGGDSGQWGQLLNDYLNVAHNADGTLKSNTVGVPQIAAAGDPDDGQVLSYSGSGLTWTTVSGSGTVPDATSSTKGLVQLTGDLAGTAASPTVPGLAGKEATVVAGTTSQYYRGDKSWQTLNKAAVGLGNVDDTSDANKPISTATQVALDNKSSINHSHAASAISSGTLAAARLPAATDTAIGAVELATTVEATTGTDTTRAVTPAGLKAAIPAPQVLFVNSLSEIPPGTPVDTLVVVRAA